MKRILLLCLFYVLISNSPIQGQFINEFHYTNAGPDVGEFVEVFIPEGDLNTYAVFLYNGGVDPTSATVYNSQILATTCPNGAGEACDLTGAGCFVVANFSRIQNGPNDGIALVRDPAGAATVVQFISYSGPCTGGEGPAAGESALDIGITESNATPPGNSLQIRSIGWEADVETSGDCNETPLPVTLTSFTASIFETNTVAIDWTTASEENNEYFEVEHSIDGRSFESITYVNGTGFSYIPQSYQHLHKDVSTGTHYYRLKQVDFDGTTTYSEVISIELDKGPIAAGSLALSPTLVEQQLNFTFPNTGTASGQLAIFNATGIQVAAMTVPAGENTMQLNAGDWLSGHYFVLFQVGAERYSARFVKL